MFAQVEFVQLCVWRIIRNSCAPLQHPISPNFSWMDRLILQTLQRQLQPRVWAVYQPPEKHIIEWVYLAAYISDR